MKNWINLVLLLTMISAISCKTKDDPNAQINKEIAAIDATVFNGTNHVVADSLGDRVVLDVLGSDATPSYNQTVTVNYTSFLFSDRTQFGAGTLHQKVSDISIPGLQAGIMVLMKGGSGSIFIPSKYAFGSQGTSLVPPNSSVIYSVTLVDVERTAGQQAQFQADTAAIHDYIKKNSATIKNPILHPSGIWYTIDNLGTGVSPKVYDQVTFNYEGVTLADSKTFQQGTLTQYNIFNLINGLRIGIPLMQKGNTATFYIPSILGYGSRGSSPGIPPNANLIFTITLTSIF